MQEPRDPLNGHGKSGRGSGGPSGADRVTKLLDALGEGLFEIDLDGRFTSVNRALESILGVSKGELAGRTYGEALAPSSAEHLFAEFKKIYLTGLDIRQAIHKIKRADGAERQVQISARLIQGPGGDPRGIAGVVRDVTEAQESRAMVDATLDCQPFQVALLDAAGTVRVVNRAWADSPYGKPGGWECEPGSNYLAALANSAGSGDSHAALEAEGIRAVLEGRREQFTFEAPRSNGGKARWYMLMVSPLLVGGRITGALLSRMDITTRKVSEQELTTLYRAMDSSVDGLALMEPEGTFLYMNPAFAHIHGFDAPVELAGKRWSDLYSESQWDVIERDVLPQVSRLGYWTGELEGLGDSGAFHQSVSLTQLEQGRVIVCSVRDITHQKLVENELKASELKFRTIYDAITEGILVLDPSGPSIAAANPALCRMFGYDSYDDIKDLNVLEFVAEADRARVAEDLRRVIEEDYHAMQCYECRHRDGRSIWVEALGTRTDYAGRIMDLVAMRDVTRKVEAERAARASEARYRAILQSARDSIYIKNESFRYVLGNPAMAELLGIAQEEIKGKTDVDFFGREAGRTIRPADERVLAGETVELEEELLETDSGTKIFHTVKAPLRGEGDSIVGICGISRDVTEQVESRRHLEESERRFRHIVESAPDFFFYIHDREGHYSYISPGVEQVTGFGAGYFLDAHAPITTDSPLNEEALRITARTFETGTPPPPYRIEVRHRDGRVILLETFEKPIVREGRAVEVMGLCHKVSRDAGEEGTEKPGREKR